jgi:hypothetical protein
VKPDNFEEFGVGNLSRNTKVVKLFELFDMGGKGQGQESGGGEGWEPSPSVGSEQVLQCALQIVHSKRYVLSLHSPSQLNPQTPYPPSFLSHTGT